MSYCTAVKGCGRKNDHPEMIFLCCNPDRRQKERKPKHRFLSFPGSNERYL